MKTILIIDDDEMFRKALGLTLTELGYKVVEATNGKEGMEAYARQLVDLIMVDLIMPEKEGIETIIDIRKSQPSVKILAMSGGGRGSATGYLLAAKAFGADRMLAKPFANDELLAVLHELLP